MLQVQRLTLIINAANYLQLIRAIAAALRIAWSFNQVLESFSPNLCGCAAVNRAGTRRVGKWDIVSRAG
jgi:hypothetical protein